MDEKINIDPQLIKKVSVEINALGKDTKDVLQHKLNELETALDKKSLWDTRSKFNSLQDMVKGLHLDNTVNALDQVETQAKKHILTPNFQGGKDVIEEIKSTIAANAKHLSAAGVSMAGDANLGHAQNPPLIAGATSKTPAR